MRTWSWLAAVALLGGVQASGQQAVVVAEPGSAAGEVLAARATAAGYTPRVTAPGALTLDPAVDSLVLAERLDRLPLAAMEALVAWVGAGGDLYSGGGEPFSEPLYQDAAGRWLTKSEALAAATPTRPGVEWTDGLTVRGASNDPNTQSTVHLAQPGPDGQPTALRLEVVGLTGWNTFRIDLPASPFGAGEELTEVWVRGTPGQATTLEWVESDRSRWIASIPLTDEWQRHVLEPADFHYWPHDGRDDRQYTTFNPAEARVLGFGPAMGHGSAHEGDLTVELSAVRPAARVGDTVPFAQPVIETLSPWYKQYVNPAGLRRPFQRAVGATLTPEQEGRHTIAADGLSRYAAVNGATLWWRPEGVTSPAAAGDAAALAGARAGVRLLNAGPEHVVSLAGEELVVGARLVNGGRAARTVELRWSLDGAALGSAQVDLPAGAQAEVKRPPRAVAEAGVHEIVTEALVDGAVVETVRAAWRLEPAGGATVERPGYGWLAAREGQYWLGDTPVFLYGVNYWPRNVSGLEPQRYWEGWLRPENYDPEVIEADLTLMEELGINLVSVQYTYAMMGRPLRDFLARCAAHGVWAHVYTGSANDLRADFDHDRELIEAAGLVGNPAVAMLDLAWEPRLGDQGQRRRHDGAWAAWVDEQYGSLAAAEEIWGVPGERHEGQLTNPAQAQLTADGPWRVMVAAYRRFADDLISRHYGYVCDFLRDQEPRWLLGVRTGYGGTGQDFANSVMAYDLTAGAAHLDYISPEGYGMPASWEAARGTGFITAWGRWAGGGKPVFWSEFGSSIGPRGGTESTRQRQTDIWRSTLLLCRQDRAAAAAGWWWPGGWRVNEQSDFGVLEPWGEPRPALRAGLEGLANDGPWPDPADPATIVVDRDVDARGLHGAWRTHEAEFRRLTEAGHLVHVATPGTGSTTRTMPRTQVGGLPYNGVGPLQYANAELTQVADGVALVNTGEAAWDGCALVVGYARHDLAYIPRFGRHVVTLTGVGGAVARVETAEGVPFGQALTIEP